MRRFQEIDAARKLLKLPEKATLEEIKTSYRNRIMEWHPDRCRHPVEQCTEMTAKIVAAYRVLIDYCSNYQYSFSLDVVREHLSGEDWWLERFGQDPVWGK